MFWLWATHRKHWKVHYSEGFQAWNTIKIKKELFSEFPELREKRSKFSYELVFCRDYEELLKKIKSLKQQSVLPVLMWLYKEDETLNTKLNYNRR